MRIARADVIDVQLVTAAPAPHGDVDVRALRVPMAPRSGSGGILKQSTERAGVEVAARVRRFAATFHERYAAQWISDALVASGLIEQLVPMASQRTPAVGTTRLSINGGRLGIEFPSAAPSEAVRQVLAAIDEYRYVAERVGSGQQRRPA